MPHSATTGGRAGVGTHRAAGGRGRWWAIVLVSAAALGGCDWGAPQVDMDAWAPEVEEARARASSDFEREVLADGRVTREEYEQAHDLLVECMQEAGHPASLSEDEFGQFSLTTGGAGSEQAMDTCSASTTDIVSAIHTGMRFNPQARDFTELVAECLVDIGAVDESFAAAELDAWFGQQEVISGEVIACTQDPLGIAS